MQKPYPPYYQPVRDDGATHKCEQCQKRLSNSNVFVCHTSMQSYTLCFDCIDDDWIALAVFYPVPL